MATEISRPSESADDCEQDKTPILFEENGLINITGSMDIDESDPGVSSDTLFLGIRFPSVDIAQGTQIDSAELKLRIHSQQCADGNNCNSTIHGADEDDIAIWARPTDKPSLMTKTTANVNWTETTNKSVNGLGTATFDVKTIIQEILDRSGWSSGNAMGILIEPGTWEPANTINVVSWDSEEANRPTLTIDFPSGTRRVFVTTIA